MTTKLAKYGLMITAAVLLVALAFAGVAAGAVAEVEPEHPTSEITVAIIKNDGSSDTLKISSGLNKVSLIANEANWKYVTTHSGIWGSNQILVLTNDIVFTEPVGSVGTSTTKFSGTIYGNGSKFINFTQSGSDAHGLIYYAVDGCVLNNVHIYDSNIASGSKHVGGLVGCANSASKKVVQLVGCSVAFSNVTSGDFNAGGLVGTVYTTELWVYASWVDHAYVKAAGNTIRVEAVAATGYHFDKWNVTKVSGGTVDVDSTSAAGNFIMPAEAVNAGANFAANVTTVTYQNETGITYDTKVYTFNESASLPATDPTKEGYTFNGWNITVGGQEYPFNGNTTYFENGKWVFLGVNNTALTVNASWTANSYTITNTSSDPIRGSTAVNKTGEAKANEDVKVEAFANAGYHFVNWTCVNITSDVTTNPYIFTMPAKNVALTANFAANVTTLYFYGDTGFLESKVNTYGQATNFTAIPSKSGFSGYWNVSESGKRLTDSTYVDGTTWKYNGGTGATLHVYVNWTQNPTPVPTQSSGGGSYSEEHTIILPEPVDSTVNPKMNSTIQPTIVPGTIPTAQQTQKSPAPFVGIIAGLGAAALLMRMRK